VSDAEIRGLTAAGALDRIKAGDLAAAEYASAFDGAGDELNAFLWAREEAPDPGEGALGGIPVAVKDIFCTKGVPTTAGSKILEGYRPPYTSTAVARLEAAGASTLAKTNMDEFAMGSSNENSAFGDVLNPWDHDRVPGGSSGGSAAAVAAGLAPVALGTDTGGSIRQPAALCGIVGLKPTYGAISRYGMIAFASSLDQCGPLTRDVTDAALLLRELEGRDARDSTSTGIPGGVEIPSGADLSGIRFGVATDFSDEAEGVEPDVAQLFRATLDLIRTQGGKIVDVELPNATHGLSAYYVIAPAEASANLARFDGVRYGLRVDRDEDTHQHSSDSRRSSLNQSLGEMYERTRSQGFGAEVKRRIMLGTYALSSGYYDAYYGQAQRVRTKIAGDFREAFEKCDFVVTPTSPSVAFKRGERTKDPLAMYLSDFFTVPMSLAGIPAISIPAGLGAASGLPVGFQIAGPAYSESRLLSAAQSLEDAISFDGRSAS
jgi:aspartyl-tRNA(Asn)/glutamyl-tRNA(Gln) amidotransferase subunit A